MRKNFLFYTGHIFLGAWFICLSQGRGGFIHLLVVIAILLYVIALLRAGSHYREEIHGGAAALSQDQVCIGFGQYIKGKMESPYTLILSNTSNEIKKIPLFISHDIDEYVKGWQYNINSGSGHLTLNQILKNIKNNPKNFCQIQIFCSYSQSAIPVVYQHEIKDPNILPERELTNESVDIHMKTIYCNVSLKHGNALKFTMLPQSHMVVKLYPYREII